MPPFRRKHAGDDGGRRLRGTLWETIAVPELRSQARRTAETVLDLTTGTGSSYESVIEYMI